MADTKTSAEPVTATSLANGDLIRIAQDLGGGTYGNAKIDWAHIATQIAGLNKAWSTITGTPTTLGGYGITDAVPSTRAVNGHALSSNVVVTAADIGTFTSIAAGVVPASGGGTANFIRADGSWAVPPGTGGSGSPAGSDTQVQFNNAGSFGASATFKLKLTPSPTLILGDVLTGVDLIVTSDNGASGHVDGRNLIINGGDGFDNGASGNAGGGSLEFSGGDSHGASDAGDAEIGGGTAFDSGGGGPAFVSGGNSNSGAGGDVHLNPGNSTSGAKGQIKAKVPGGADVVLFDSTISLDVARIAANSIANAKLATMAASTIKGSVSGGTPADLTGTQVAAIASPFIVPASYQSTQWNSSIGGGGGPNSFAANTIWFADIVLFASILSPVATAIAVKVTSGSSANSAAAIYSVIGNRPNSLLRQSANTAVGINNKQVWTLTSPISLANLAGCCLAVWSDTAITMTLYGAANAPSILGQADVNFADLQGINLLGWKQSLTYTGTFPSTASSLVAVTTTGVPQLMWQQQ